MNLVGAKNKSKTSAWLSFLFCVACFQPQFFFLPVFAWSFLSLFIIWMSGVFSKKRSIAQPKNSKQGYEWSVGLLLLIPVVLNGSNLVSIIYLITSICCAVICQKVATKDTYMVGYSIVLFLRLNFIILLFACLSTLIGDEPSSFFVYSNSGDYLRFRGLQLEPNHLGFSLITIYLLMLFLPEKKLNLTSQSKSIAIFMIWVLVLVTFSPFVYFMMCVVSLFCFWTNLKRKTLVVLMVLTVLMIGIQTERFDQIISGDDNSANLRTWGSLFIAKIQVDKCGILGCGLGSGRSILEDEPLMSAFAAQDTLVLPNLFAGAMVEGGYVLALLFLLVMLFVAFPRKIYKENISRRCGIISFVFLIGYTFTGSFPYDAHLWSVIGLIFFLVRVNLVNNSDGK